MNSLKHFLITVILSAAAGILVGLPIILYESAPLVENLLKSGVAGCSIGIAAYLIAGFIFRNIRSHTCWAFFSVIIIIASGTLLGGYLSGITKIQHFIAAVAGGEIVGIILTSLLYRYSMKLNDKLKSVKERYRSN